MKNNILLAALAMLYQVSHSNSWINYKLEPFRGNQIERTIFKESHNYGEISIKREGGLKETVSKLTKSNEAMVNKINPKEQKLNDIRLTRKSRSNDTKISEKIKEANFSNEIQKPFNKIQEKNHKIFNIQEIENSIESNSSEFNARFGYKEDTKETNFEGHNVTLSYKDDLKETNYSYGNEYTKQQNPFRHLWGQDRSIHSYRSSTMHKKPYWYSPYHFPRAKVTVAGLNIPWFRLRSTHNNPLNVYTEPVTPSKSEDTFQMQLNTPYLSTTLVPLSREFEILTMNVPNISETKSNTSFYRNIFSQSTPFSTKNLPRWPNWLNRGNFHTSEKALPYKNIRISSINTDKSTIISSTEPWFHEAKKTSKVLLKKNVAFTTSKQNMIEKSTVNNRFSITGIKAETPTTKIEKGVNILLATTPRVGTTMTPIREPQWPPWPQWFHEPLQLQHKTLYNNSYVLNEYTANVYSNDEKLATVNMNLSKQNNAATESINRIEKKDMFLDYGDAFKSYTAAKLYSAVFKPATTVLTIEDTTEAKEMIDRIVERGPLSSYAGNTSLLPNLRNIVRCSQGCPLTPEFNPVCGTDDITYTNPGRLLCLQFCGLDVRVKKYQPCSSKHKLSEYPNMVNLFLNTALESIRATVKTTASPTKESTVFYGIDAFTMNEEDDYMPDLKSIVKTPTEMTIPSTTPPISVKTYIERLKKLINYSPDGSKHSPGIKSNGGERKKAMPSVKKIDAKLSELNTEKHLVNEVTTSHPTAGHSVKYSRKYVGTKHFSMNTVTHSITDISTKQNKIDATISPKNNANTKNNPTFKHGTHLPFGDSIDSLDDPNNNGRRYVESPFGDLPYNSGEYVAPDDSSNDIFQDSQKESDDNADADSKFWGYEPSDREKSGDNREENKAEESTQKLDSLKA